MSLHGFEEFTHELNIYEKETLLPLFIAGFEKRIGVEKAITNKQILAGFKSQVDKQGNPYKINDARVRKIVNHIRLHGLIKGLIASSKGYYISTDEVEIARYIDSLKARSSAISRVSESMKDYLRQLLKHAA